jgi:hypothetical protein
MPNFVTLDLQTLLRRIGRAKIFYAVDSLGEPMRWDPGSPILLNHLGDTQGDVVFTPNAVVAPLTLEEISGDAEYEGDYVGENPVLEAPLFLADPALYRVISPIGVAHAGHFLTQPVHERTLVVFPERLFKLASGQGFGTVSYDRTNGWRFEGVDLDDARETLLALSLFIWRCRASRPPRRFRGGHGNESKNIESVQFTAMMHPLIPNGHRLYTDGDPSLYGIELDPAVS